MIKLPNCQSTKGFSLVELMVVVTIMAVLSVIALTIYIDTQKSSRDSRRKADMTAISNALEASASATAGQYSAVEDSFFVGGKPRDPINTGTLSYTYPSAGPTYTMCAELEKPTGNYCDALGTDYASDGCSTGTAKYFCIKNRQ